MSDQTPHSAQDAASISCAVITVSDTRTPATDQSGQLMKGQLESTGHTVAHYQIIEDDADQITTLIKSLAKRPDIQAILINGGTGIAPRDMTYDAISKLLTKELPGFGEIFRQLSYAEIGSSAIASRAVAGVRTQGTNGSTRNTLIFSVPGSSKAVKLALEALILPELVHLTTLIA